MEGIRCIKGVLGVTSVNLLGLIKDKDTFSSRSCRLKAEIAAVPTCRYFKWVYYGQFDGGVWSRSYSLAPVEHLSLIPRHARQPQLNESWQRQTVWSVTGGSAGGHQ